MKLLFLLFLFGISYSSPTTGNYKKTYIYFHKDFKHPSPIFRSYSDLALISMTPNNLDESCVNTARLSCGKTRWPLAGDGRLDYTNRTSKPTIRTQWYTMGTRTAELLCLLCAITLTVQQCLTPNDARGASNPLAYRRLYRGHQDFSLSLLEQINKRQSTSENIFFSPYSVYHALMMAYFISSNHTEKALHDTLRFGPNQDKIDILQAYKFDKYAKQPYEFSSANRIYYAAQLLVRDCMKEHFEDELQKLDFKANPAGAVEKINNWVQEKTRGMIADLLPVDAVDQNTNLVLVNAAYFKGKWQSQFQAENTHKAIFYISPSENTFVDMMTQEGTFNHGESHGNFLFITFEQRES